MRKQYHSRQVGDDTFTWDVHSLVKLSTDLPVKLVPLGNIAELDENWWFANGKDIASPRAIAHHMELVNKTDLAYPIILCAEGRLMDGMHRVVKALVENRPVIHAVQFSATPAPDFLNVDIDSLPYDDDGPIS